jgi:hypothetical protein
LTAIQAFSRSLLLRYYQFLIDLPLHSFEVFHLDDV